MMTAIEDGDNEYIDEQLAFWSFGWIVLLFAYLFAMKLIGSTKSDYVNQFFSSKLAKSDPMHMGLTQMTDMAKQQAVRPIKFAGKSPSIRPAKASTSLPENVRRQERRRQGTA